jgi:hypothetical protein
VSFALAGLRFSYNDQPNATTYQNLASESFSTFQWNDSGPQCIEISTGPGLFTPNPDTRIWVRLNTSSGWVPLNDDFGGTYQSRARFWLWHATPDDFLAFQVRPYYDGGNSDDWTLTVQRLNLTESACENGRAGPGQQLIPYATLVQTTVNGNPSWEVARGNLIDDDTSDCPAGCDY